MTTMNMAPTEWKRQDRGGLRAAQHASREELENDLQRRQGFGGFFGGRNGDQDNDITGFRKFMNNVKDGTQEGSRDAFAVEAEGLKDGVSSAAKKIGDFLNPTRKLAAQSSTTQSSTTSTTASTTTTTSQSTAILPPPPPPPPNPAPQAAPAAPISTSDIQSTTQPSLPVASPSSSTSTSAVTSAPSLVTVPIVTSAPTSVIVEPTPADNVGPGIVPSTDQSRKKIPAEATGTSSITSTSTSTTEPSITSEVGDLIIATPIANQYTSEDPMIGDLNLAPSSRMSPVGQRVIIAVSVIGGLIVIIAALLLFLRVRKGEPFAMFARRKYPKLFSRAPRERRKSKHKSSFEATSAYYAEPKLYEYPSPEKNIPIQQQMEGFYNPGPLPALSIPVRARASTLPSAYSPQQENISPLTATGKSPDPFIIKTTQTETFYGVPPPHSRLPSDLNEMFVQHNLNSGASTYTNTYQSPQQARENADIYGSPNQTFTPQTSNMYDSQRGEPYRMSTLSSLSSGFGDGLIIQDTDSIRNPSIPPRHRQQQGFSWQTTASKAPQTFLDRASTYTATSIETAPRFRTVNSWVAHQKTEVERQKIVASHIPDMPPIPAQLQSDVAPVTHRRMESDDSAFNYHPGDEIRIAPGSRVPSSVLDRKFGSYMARSTE